MTKWKRIKLEQEREARKTLEGLSELVEPDDGITYKLNGVPIVSDQYVTDGRVWLINTKYLKPRP